MRVEIGGLKVEIDTDKAADWHTFSILRKSDGANGYGQLAVLFEVIEYMTDQSEASIVEHLGGESAKASDVINLATEIVQAATSKN